MSLLERTPQKLPTLVIANTNILKMCPPSINKAFFLSPILTADLQLCLGWQCHTQVLCRFQAGTSIQLCYCMVLQVVFAVGSNPHLQGPEAVGTNSDGSTN